MLTVSEMLKLSLEYVLDKYYVDYSTHNNNGGGGYFSSRFGAKPLMAMCKAATSSEKNVCISSCAIQLYRHLLKFMLVIEKVPYSVILVACTSFLPSLSYRRNKLVKINIY